MIIGFSIEWKNEILIETNSNMEISSIIFERIIAPDGRIYDEFSSIIDDNEGARDKCFN